MAKSTPSMQRTLMNPVTAQGVGLHSGQKVTMTLAPAPADHGIVFQRSDLLGKPLVPALYDRVLDARLCTQIIENGVSVSTIEHVMAALRAAGIDNCLMTLDGPEVPIMDGSAEPFSFLLTCAGSVQQDVPRHRARLTKTIRVTEGDKWAEFSPADLASYSFVADFDHPLITAQERTLTLVNGNFPTQIARARTFCFARDIEMLRAAGLIKGGSLENAIVVDETGVLNEGGLRFDDEFVRHKILDAVGDLYLAGMPLIGHYRGFKAGHALNNKLLRAVFADPGALAAV